MQQTIKNPKKAHAKMNGTVICLSISFYFFESTKLKLYSVKVILRRVALICILPMMSLPKSASADQVPS